MFNETDFYGHALVLDTCFPECVRDVLVPARVAGLFIRALQPWKAENKESKKYSLHKKKHSVWDHTVTTLLPPEWFLRFMLLR